jgi:hypothetical protein
MEFINFMLYQYLFFREDLPKYQLTPSLRGVFIKYIEHKADMLLDSLGI